MSANLFALTDDNWKSEVLEASVPVMVDFWAPWCGPCRMLAPTIEKLAGEFEDRVKVGIMNTDENEETPGSYRISAIPTVLIFQGGKEVDRLVGVNTESKFKAALAKVLKGSPGATPPPEQKPTPADPFSVDPEDSSGDEVEEALERNRSGRQGFRLTKELRQAIEHHAMDEAKRHFKSQGYLVDDHSQGHSYDLRCRRADGDLYVEVKGTQTAGKGIILTNGEVNFARSNKDQMALFILHSITAEEIDGKANVSGGHKRLISPWNVDCGRLQPTHFQYQMPNLDDETSSTDHL